MKQDKFIVKIPFNQNENNEIEYRIFKFSTVKEMAKFLECTSNTIYSLRTKRLKMKHESKIHLQGIEIEKIPVYYNAKKDLNNIEKIKNDFKLKLISK